MAVLTTVVIVKVEDGSTPYCCKHPGSTPSHPRYGKLAMVIGVASAAEFHFGTSGGRTKYSPQGSWTRNNFQVMDQSAHRLTVGEVGLAAGREDVGARRAKANEARALIAGGFYLESSSFSSLSNN